MSEISPHAIIQTDDLGINVRIDEFTVIRPTAHIGNNVIIHPHVVINENVIVGDGVEIFSGSVLGWEQKSADNSSEKGGKRKQLIIGANCLIGPHSVICYNIEVGENAVVEAGTIVRSTVPPHVFIRGHNAPQKLDNSGNNLVIHQCALVESIQIGSGTRIWAHTHILPGARIGEDCNICDQTFIENDVVIGNRVTVKSGVHIWDGTRIEDDVFIGPSVTFTNDHYPRSKQYPTEFLKITIRKGASIGANATLLPGISIGEKAMVGAGAVVTKDVPANAIVVGNPARIVRLLQNGKE